MAKITLTGTLSLIGATQSFGSNGFTKREIVVQEDGMKYPNPVKFTLKKDHCALADNYHEGDQVTVTASINGRKWTNPKTQKDQYFVDLEAYKIESGAGGNAKNEVPAPAVPDVNVDMSDDGDVPF